MPNDRITSFECTYNLINYGAAEEAAISSNSVKSFCDVNELMSSAVNYSYMTLEHNYSILDGGLSEFPDSFSTPYFSSAMSNEVGQFDSEAYITSGYAYHKGGIAYWGGGGYADLSISFIQPQNAYGLTFLFVESYPLEIEISWKDVLNNRREVIVYPDSLTYVAPISFLNCMSIEIHFIKTVPFRYIKLLGMVFGQTFNWTENEINNGNLLLETDVLSDKISINQLSFKVIDIDNMYNLANDNALHKYFQKRQEVIAYEWVNGERLYLGNYFLDNFSVENNLVNLKCVSYIGLLDDVSYNEGDIYNGKLAGELLEDIFSIAKVSDYLIDAETYNTKLYGTIKPMTCREALREILFACGSIVNTTSEDGIVITKVDKIIDNTIYRANKVSTKITKNDYVHGVEVEYANYKLLDEAEEIVREQSYLAGEYTIVFSDAYIDIQIKTSTGKTIKPTEVKKYYCKFTLLDDAVLTISGRKYEENLSTIQVANQYVQSGESLTINQYSSRLCNAAMAKTKAAEILDYLQYRLTLDVKAITSDISMEGRKWVENPNQGYANFITWYTSRNLNLTGGFIDTAKLVGYYYGDYGYYYAGEELYAGEEVGVL